MTSDVDEAEALGAYVDRASALQGMPLAPEWRSAVVANLSAIAAAARLVEALPLPDEAQPAPVFTA